mgnify:CR=1 FL=1
MATNLTMHLSKDFVQYVTGSPDGTAGTDTLNGSWVYLFQTQPPTGQSSWTPLVLNSALEQTVKLNATNGDYEINIPLTNATTPTVNSAAILCSEIIRQKAPGSGVPTGLPS